MSIPKLILHVTLLFGIFRHSMTKEIFHHVMFNENYFLNSIPSYLDVGNGIYDSHIPLSVTSEGKLGFNGFCSQPFEIDTLIINQEFQNQLIKEVVLKVHPIKSKNRSTRYVFKEYQGYVLLLNVSKEGDVNISKIELEPGGEFHPITKEIQNRFFQSIASEALIPLFGCTLAYPVLFQTRSSKPLENNRREELKNLDSLISMQEFDCFQFQEPIIVSGRRGI